jgi:hypothetical protein
MNPSQTLTSAATPRLGLALLTYIYLQGLDLLTTVAFLLSGVEEANPVVRWAMEQAANPLLGLMLVKMAAMLLGLYCWASNRGLLLQRANYGYAALIVWNLTCLVFGLLNNLN